ncbi:MAG TPA: integrin alpha [candidate division Zixibacteria bacterium]|nr:integrin alpha [candidate division Zixibacteria bacterium]
MKSNVLASLAGLFLSLLAAHTAFTQCQPLYVFTGKAAFDYFGYTVSGAGDVNNDGYDDVVIGALANHDNNPDSAGQVFVFSGLDGDTLYTFTGPNVSEKFGYSVAGAGDVNNDGYSDIIIGAPQNSDSGAQAGKVYVFSGLDGDTLYRFWGEEAGDKFGTAVASAGDVNDDNYDDIIIGAPLFDLSFFNGGEAYIISGQTGIGINRISAPGPDDEFSSAVASAGDVDGDGKSDVIVGARLNNNNGSDAGFATVMSQGTFLVGLYEGGGRQ